MKLKILRLLFGVLLLIIGGLAIWQGVQPEPYGGVFGKITGKVTGLVGANNPLKSDDPPRWQWNASTIGGIIAVVAGSALVLTSRKKEPEYDYDDYY